jgi:hypothetical protein
MTRHTRPEAFELENEFITCHFHVADTFLLHRSSRKAQTSFFQNTAGHTVRAHTVKFKNESLSSSTKSKKGIHDNHLLYTVLQGKSIECTFQEAKAL